MRHYKCLVLDHDDTAVDSTARIHYPAFLEAMKLLRPGVFMSLEEYFFMNCTPGLGAYYRDVVKLTEAERAVEAKTWLDYVAAHVPAAYPGISRILCEQKSRGGYFCVISHSRKENILRDYTANGLPAPDLVYGSELPSERRKPSPWPVQDLMRRLDLAPADILVVDDLTPGYEMAKSAGVDFAAACWAHQIPQIRAFLSERGVRCFGSPVELYDHLYAD